MSEYHIINPRPVKAKFPITVKRFQVYLLMVFTFFLYVKIDNSFCQKTFLFFFNLYLKVGLTIIKYQTI